MCSCPTKTTGLELAAAAAAYRLKEPRDSFHKVSCQQTALKSVISLITGTSRGFNLLLTHCPVCIYHSIRTLIRGKWTKQKQAPNWSREETLVWQENTKSDLQGCKQRTFLRLMLFPCQLVWPKYGKQICKLLLVCNWLGSYVRSSYSLESCVTFMKTKLQPWFRLKWFLYMFIICIHFLALSVSSFSQ